MSDNENVLIRLPPELVVIVQSYKSYRRLPHFSTAIKELLETHPSILALLARSQYDNDKTQGDPEGE